MSRLTLMKNNVGRYLGANSSFKCSFACIERPQFIFPFVFLSVDQHETNFSVSGEKMNLNILLRLKLRVRAHVNSSQHQVSSVNTWTEWKPAGYSKRTDAIGKVTSSPALCFCIKLERCCRKQK